MVIQASVRKGSYWVSNSTLDRSLCVCVLVCACISIYACLCVFVFQCVDVFVFECIDVIVFECIDVFVFECMDVFVFECMDALFVLQGSMASVTRAYFDEEANQVLKSLPLLFPYYNFYYYFHPTNLRH